MAGQLACRDLDEAGHFHGLREGELPATTGRHREPGLPQTEPDPVELGRPDLRAGKVRAATCGLRDKPQPPEYSKADA